MRAEQQIAVDGRRLGDQLIAESSPSARSASSSPTTAPCCRDPGSCFVVLRSDGTGWEFQQCRAGY